MRLLISTVFVLFTSMVGHATQLPFIGKIPTFSDGDTVIFIGDSITHGGSYHTNIVLFNATRYPSKKVDYINAGISGDTTQGTNLRFDRDIAIHRPNIATIMLGMNDVGGHLYQTPVKTDAEKAARAEQQKVIRDKYLVEMQKLATSLQDIGTDIIFMTPSIYDETAELALPSDVGRNSELGVYAQKLYQLAKDYDSPVVDFQRSMLDVNTKMQEKDPTQTIVGKDRVHPGGAGHLVMTYAFLKAQKESPSVSNIQINVSRHLENDFENCELVGDVSYTRSGLQFSCRQNSLPFPLNDEQKEALAWIPFQKELNQMRFSVSHLAKGTYKLSIDGQVIGDFEEYQLAEGLNLANFTDTPIYQQALKVKQFNDQRAKFARKIRDIAHVTYSMLDKYPEIDRSDPLAVEATLNQHVEKSLGKPWYGYLRNQIKNYLTNYGKVPEYRQNISKLQTQMYIENQPKVYSWSLAKI